MSQAFRTGLWRLSDPKISLASLAALFLGTSLAARDGALSVPWLVVTVFGIFALEVAKNASGEIVDFDSGADLAVGPEDRSPFSGGKRVMVDDLLTRGQTAAIAAVAYGLSIAAGLVIVFGRDPRVLPLGVAGVAAAFFYHAPPVRLAYRGLGELAVACSYGPLITVGADLVQRGRLSAEVIGASIPLGLMIGDFLLINEFPDARADAKAGKRTLVVRLGRERASALYASIAALAFLVLLLLPLFGPPAGLRLGALGIAPAARAAWVLRRHREETRFLVPAQALALFSFVLLALCGGIGVLLVR